MMRGASYPSRCRRQAVQSHCDVEGDLQRLIVSGAIFVAVLGLMTILAPGANSAEDASHYEIGYLAPWRQIDNRS